MNKIDQAVLKKYTLVFNSISDLLAFKRKADPPGYLLLPQVNIISGRFSESEIDTALNEFNAVIKTSFFDMNENES